MVNRIQITLLVGLVSTISIFGTFIITGSVSADDDASIDNVSVSVPVSCSMEGTGMNSHTATIPNGIYQANIGTTTLKALCNDSEGFAIYATGYTGEEIGKENSNKLVGVPSSIGNIATGNATSGETSNWAMKLATNSSATYALTLDNGFGNYSAVPNEYTKVAHRDSGTDAGANSVGSELTTTYAAYISKTQDAGIYTGKVFMH